MASIAALRERLRKDLGDILAELGEPRFFENEQLESSLFDSLQQHNKDLTWSELPSHEEQLVLLLAKSDLCCTKAMQYGMDTKKQVGPNFAVGKVDNAQFLANLCERFREEYDDRSNMLDEVGEGEILVGDIRRFSRVAAAKVPYQNAKVPDPPELLSAQWFYDAEKLKGKFRLTWRRLSDKDLAHMKIFVVTDPNFVYMGQVEPIRTLYDFQGGVAFDNAPIAQQAADIEVEILPTGDYAVLALATNWNNLKSLSAPISLKVENYIDVEADAFVVFDTTETTTTSTTTTSTTTSTSTSTTT